MAAAIYAIDRSSRVLTASICRLRIVTADSAPPRELMHGIDPEGRHHIWMETAGGPIALTGDPGADHMLELYFGWHSRLAAQLIRSTEEDPLQ